MADITIPKLNTVDVSYTLTEWRFADGDLVPAGVVVAVIETSKVAEELVSDRSGVLHRLLYPPAECELGTVIGRLFGDEDERVAFASAAVDTDPAGIPGGGADAELVVTNAARELIDRHQLGPERLRGLGKKLITQADVARLVDEPGRYVLSPNQRAVAKVVAASHRSIPAAFMAIKIDPTQALTFQRRFAERHRLRVGLPELLVKVTASLLGAFPLVFAAISDEGAVTLAGQAHVGITMDAGKGLYVPVVTDAAGATLARVAEILAEYRFRALRGQFAHTHLAGANIAITLTDDDAIVAAQPLVFPPSSCTLALCSTQEEVFIDDAGQAARRPYFHLGLAYDHRLINGREAGLFLAEIKRTLEDAELLDALAGGADET